MSFINYDDVARQLSAAGLVFESLDVGTAAIVRCAAEGSKGKPGWYRLYAFAVDGGEVICGAFGVFSGPGTDVLKVVLDKDSLPRLSPEQVAADKARRLADKREAAAAQRAKHEKAAAKAASWWRACVDQGESAYLTRKGLPASRLFGARLDGTGNLVVPVQDVTGKTWGVQVIYHDPAVKQRKGRDKEFAPTGMLKREHFFIIGAVSPGGMALLCEGFATGASLHEATGLPVIVAFDAGNLAPVALAIAKHYRGVRILIAADDDYLQTCSACKTWTMVLDPACSACGEPHRKKNSGIDAAKIAALPLQQAGIVWPMFPGERPTTHKGGTDFNDLHTCPDGGLSMVARQVEASLSALQWRSVKLAPIRAAADGKGGGDSPRDPMRSIYTLDEAVERWTLLYGGGGAYFDEHDRCIVQKQDVLALIHDHAAREWKLRPDRKVARFSGVGFDPTGLDANVICNLWGGWPTTPKAGDCEVLLDLLRYMCKLEPNADEVYRWALRWLAYPIQHPGAKLKTTLVFHGLQGAGKNAFFEAYADIYGEYSSVVDQRAIESPFNDWASKKLFIVFDEVIARNEVYGLKNLIKSLITGQTIRINPKNTAAWYETNHANGVWLSNEQHPAAVELSDRRYFVIYTPPALSEAYYNDVKACLDNGGVAALHHYLLNLDLGDFHEHSKPPMTKAKAELQQLSAGSVERFLIEWQAGETRYPLCPCASAQIYRAYSRWCTAQGEKPRIQNALSGYLGKQLGWSIERKDVFSTAHYSGSPARTRMVIPPDGLLPKGFRKTPDKTEAQWATDCYFTFDEVLGGHGDV